MIRAAAEDDINRILEIEREAISPPWTHGMLLSEIYNEDSFFALSSADEEVTGTIPPDDGQAGFCGASNNGCSEISPIDSYGKSSEEASSLAAPVLGFIVLRRAADEGELLQIAVAGAAQRRGVADSLMSEALNRARGTGVETVYLEVRKSNTAAVSLYKKHGFAFSGTRKNYYADPTEDAAVMKLILSAGQN